VNIHFPESLPVSARKDDIAKALLDHQVIVVCGETGSGKTTQLPKIALSIGRGLVAGGKGIIGHTQPRRLAATSVAKRIAQELDTPLGEVVGYKIRFSDRLQPGASIKLMTDGMVLAETQSDPLLRAYDTLIVDEAHERSLNIDFLLGHLKQILPRRPDLKVIVTSATIDADRFSQHFAHAQTGPAPVITVSGRTYPVEIRWRPVMDLAKAKPETSTKPRSAEDDKPRDRASQRPQERAINDAIVDAVDELWAGSARGDILIFLPGEREIRDAADALESHFKRARRGGPPPEVMPLFARLSQAEQDRVFQPSGGQRIVLATNVAETSLTVPGIRFVVDAGTARVKRYSHRTKVERLQVEAISQAAAQQRAGRCGRVADGVCIRLYDEADHASRPAFTDPEILRSSLAGVILRMKSLRLGSVEDFPFLEAPSRKSINDGHELLHELGATSLQGDLTPLGASLARLPLDPRIGRMILAARDHHCLSEVLVMAAACSVQDVRDRPLAQQQAADEKHKRFDHEKSEFLGDLTLWRWIEEGRGVHGHAHSTATQPLDSHKLSNRQQEQRLREHFISPRRAREWRDVHAQLLTVVAEQGWRVNASPATDEQIHTALLTGLLGNVGCKLEDGEGYLGARGIKFLPHPGVHLSKKPGRWVMAVELVETTRLYARGIANIDVAWLPKVGAHLLKTQLLDPKWEKKAGEVVALERATLHGLVVYNDKKVSFANVDPVAARTIFIREALVAGDWESTLPFVVHNRKLIREVEALEHKARRQDVLVDDTLIEAFYDAHIPAEVVGAATLERWYRAAQRANPKLLLLTRDDLMRHEAAGITTQAFPPTVKIGGMDCAATYLHEPGHARDGVTVTVPLYALNQVSESRCDWLVPGMLEPKVLALLKSLPQRPRSRLVPLPASAKALAQALSEPEVFGHGELIDALLKQVRAKTELPVPRHDFKADQLGAHLIMNVRVVDEHGRQLAMARNVPSLKAEWGDKARGAFQALASLKLSATGAPKLEGVQRQELDVAEGPTQAKNVARRVKPVGTSSPNAAAAPGAVSADAPHTTWDFGALPDMLEVSKAGQSLIGFPALLDRADHVVIEVFDEPDVALAKHKLGLRRLFAIALKEPLKYLDKNVPDMQRMAMAYMPLGSADDLRALILNTALTRACLAEPWPNDAKTFDERVLAARPRLSLITQEVARLALSVLTEHAAALRKLKDSKPSKDVAEDVQAQLQAMVSPRFLDDVSWSQLQHLPRYLKAVVMRLDKWRQDPVRDAEHTAQLRPRVQRHQRKVGERRGATDARLEEHRWLLEEFRVSLFAQTLRTPTPVSAKRLDKLWEQINA
jgi:ATP-dependent helicase HrpA